MGSPNKLILEAFERLLCALGAPGARERGQNGVMDSGHTCPHLSHITRVHSTHYMHGLTKKAHFGAILGHLEAIWGPFVRIWVLVGAKGRDENGVMDSGHT